MGDGTGHLARDEAASTPPEDAGRLLSEAEADLVKAVLAGEEADLKRRPVRASVVRDLLTQARPGWVLPPLGARLTRVIVQGSLDLDGCTLTKPVVIRYSSFEGSGDDATILIRDAHLKRLDIHASTIVGNLIGDRCNIESGLYLGGGQIKGVIQLRGAVIGGVLALEDTEFGDGKAALLAAGIRLAGPLILRRCRALGAISFPRGHMDAGIDADGARIVADGVALDAESARIGGDVALAEAEIKGRVCLASVRLEGRLTGEGLSIDAIPVALDARGLDVSHGITLDNARLRGSAVLEGAVVGKTFRAEAIEVDGGETAIGADGIGIGGNWDMPRAKLIGELKFCGARVEGQLQLTEARLFGSGVAIRGDGAELRGGCTLSRATVLGLVRFPAAQIANQFCLSGASIKVEDGAVLQACGASFGRDIELTEGFQCVGAIVLDQARIAGTLDLRGSYLVSAAIARGGLPPQIGLGSAPDRNDELALSLVDARLNRLVMPSTSQERPRGILDLSRADAASLEDYAEAWPLPREERARSKDGRDIDHMVLDGFVYGHLAHPSGTPSNSPSSADDRRSRTTSRERVAERRIRWLEGQPARDVSEHFKPQAWIGLAERLAQQGYGDDALRVEIARRRRERRNSSAMTAGARWQSRLLDWLALYGHNPWRTVVWMAAVVVLFAGIWTSAARMCTESGCFDQTVFVVRNKDAYTGESSGVNFKKTYPAFHALAYSFDVFVPFVSFGYKDHWRPNIDYGPLAELPLPFAVAGDPPVKGAVNRSPTLAITIGGILYVLGIIEAILGLVLTALMVTGFMGLLSGRGPRAP